MLDDELRALGRDVAQGASPPPLARLRARARRRQALYTALAATAAVATVATAYTVTDPARDASRPVAPATTHSPTTPTATDAGEEVPTTAGEVIESDRSSLVDFAMLADGHRVSVWRWSPDRSCGLAEWRSAAHLADADGTQVERVWLGRGDWTADRDPNAPPDFVLTGRGLLGLDTAGSVVRIPLKGPPPRPAPPRFDQDWPVEFKAAGGKLWANGMARGAPAQRQPLIAWRDDGASWSYREVGHKGDLGAYLVLGPDGQVAALNARDGAIDPAPTDMRVSLDGGRSWTTVTEFPFDSMTGRAATSDGRLLISERRGPLWRSDPTWTSFEQVPDAPLLWTLETSGDYVYGQLAVRFGRIGTAQSKRQVAVSEDGGLSWTVFEPR